jgi:hypothetical protein
MSHPVGACPLYFGISSPALDRQQLIEGKGDKSLKRRVRDRLTPADRYEGVLDTIVQLFRVDASGVIAPDEDPMNTKKSFSNSICKQQTQMAEREFAAFISAVKELLGPEQAELSAADWLDESELIDNQRGSTSRDWRAVTIAASARLANRLNAGLHDQSFAQHVD